MNTKITKLPNSMVEIEGELSAEIFESYYKDALKHIGEKVELDGFRKGKVPESVLVSKVPEMHILEEMAEHALAEHYPKILEAEKIDAISRPEISILKIARNNPLVFKIKTAVMPLIKLPKYKDLAKGIVNGLTEKDKDTTVSDEEVENTIMDIRKSRAPKVDMKDHDHKEGDDHTHPLPELPELNDEFVKALGPFEGVEDFKTKLKENLKLEKGDQVREKTRLKIIEKIMDETKMEVPEIIIDSEVQKILYKMESDITAMGMKFEDYLKHINKTVDDLKKEFRADGEKKAKLGLILNEIAKAENIVADDEEVAKEVTHLLAHYKDADPERARLHAENVLTNEKIFQFLERES